MACALDFKKTIKGPTLEPSGATPIKYVDKIPTYCISLSSGSYVRRNILHKSQYVSKKPPHYGAASQVSSIKY